LGCFVVSNGRDSKTTQRSCAPSRITLISSVRHDRSRFSGHYNLSQGAVATIQDGAVAISGWLAGLVVVGAGYSAAFLALAGIAGVALLTLLFGLPKTRTNADEVAHFGARSRAMAD
jgi:hypothetical protein